MSFPSFLRRIPASVLLGFFWLACMLVVALFAQLLYPHPITAMDLTARLLPPLSPTYPLGTDELGRDVLSRLLRSIQVSLAIAFGATLISAALGTALGFLAARRGGWVEHLVVGLADVQAALPFLIMALAVLAFLGNSMLILVLLMGFYGWERYTRLARGLAISAEAQGYALAVIQLGASPWRVYMGHILPNVSATLIVSMTLSFPDVVLMESALSFLGLGVQPPDSSLGNMVGFGRSYLGAAPWIMLAPAVTIVFTTLAVSICGDWLRDQLDPTIFKR